jgi:PleD family two-component response regulator
MLRGIPHHTRNERKLPLKTKSEETVKGSRTVEGHSTVVDETKKTIFIYSPDLHFCFSLSMLFEDRYNVVTTTNPGMLESCVGTYAADLVLVDASPSETLIGQFAKLRTHNERIPIILLYVYSQKSVEMDKAIRTHVDSVFYKPFEIEAVSQRISELLSP